MDQVTVADEIGELRQLIRNLLQEAFELGAFSGAAGAEIFHFEHSQVVQQRGGDPFFEGPQRFGFVAGKVGDVIGDRDQLVGQRAGIRLVGQQQIERGSTAHCGQIAAAVGHDAVGDFEHRFQDAAFFGWRGGRDRLHERNDVERPLEPAAEVEESPGGVRVMLSPMSPSMAEKLTINSPSSSSSSTRSKGWVSRARTSVDESSPKEDLTGDRGFQQGVGGNL